MITVHLNEIIGSGAAAQSAFVDTGRPFCLLVPTEQLSCFSLVMPDVPQRKWATMIPWMLEEKSLQNIDSLHFAWAVEDAEKRQISVWLVEKEKLQQWISLAQHLGQLAAIRPDVLALPLSEGSWTVEMNEDLVRVRQGDNRGFACPHSWLSPIFLSLTSGFSEDQKPDLVNHSDQPLPEIYADLPFVRQDLTSSSPHTGNRESAINLLPDSERMRIKSDSKEGRSWYIAASLLVVSLLAWSASLHFQAARLEAQTADIEQLLSSLPSISTLPSSSEQQQLQTLRERSTESGVFPLLLSLDPILSNCDDCRILEMDLSAERATFRVQPGSTLPEKLTAAGIRFSQSKDSSSSLLITLESPSSLIGGVSDV